MPANVVTSVIIRSYKVIRLSIIHSVCLLCLLVMVVLVLFSAIVSMMSEHLNTFILITTHSLRNHDNNNEATNDEYHSDFSSAISVNDIVIIVCLVVFYP